MSLVYFDASALVKLVVDEAGSDLAGELWDECDAALTSRLSYPEVCAALAAAHRNHDLDARGVRGADASWKTVWASMRVVELSAAVADHAGLLARQHGLRGADAVHLASAALLGAADVIVAVWDRRLHTATTATGLAVAPATLP